MPTLGPTGPTGLIVAGLPGCDGDRFITELQDAGLVLESGAVAAWIGSALRSRGLAESGWLDRSPLPLSQALIEACPRPTAGQAWADGRAAAFWPIWQEVWPTANLILAYRSPWQVLTDWFGQDRESIALDPEMALQVCRFYYQALLDWSVAAGDRSTVVCADGAPEALAAWRRSIVDSAAIGQASSPELGPLPNSSGSPDTGSTETGSPEKRDLLIWAAHIVQTYDPDLVALYRRLQAIAIVPDQDHWGVAADVNPSQPPLSSSPIGRSTTLQAWAAASRLALAQERLAVALQTAETWRDRSQALELALPYAQLQVEQARARSGRYQFQASEAAAAVIHLQGEYDKVATQLTLTRGAIGALASRAAYAEEMYADLETASQKQELELLQELAELQAVLENTQAELATTQTEREQALADLAKTEQRLVEQAGFWHNQLDQARAQYAQAQAQFRDLRGRLELAQQVVVAMQTSKFWQVRNLWFKVKRKLKLPTTTDLASTLFAETLTALADLPLIAQPPADRPSEQATVHQTEREQVFARVRDRLSPVAQHQSHVLLNLFDALFYRDRYPDVAAALADTSYRTALDHFIKYGSVEGRNPSALFETQFYLDTYPHVRGLIAAGKFKSAIEHFIQVGLAEGYDPSPNFETEFYCTTYPDVAAAVETGHITSGFEHYLLVGLREGRLARPLRADETPQAPEPRVMFAFLSGCGGAPYRYRCQYQAEALRAFGYSVAVYEVAMYPYEELFEQARVWILHRTTYHYGLEQAVQTARSRGIRVIFESDDLIFEPRLLYQIADAAGGTQNQQQFYDDMMQQYQRTIALVDGVSVSTPKLAMALRDRFPAARVAVLPNRPDLEMMTQAAAALARPRPIEDRSIVRLGYFSGSKTHEADFAECGSALLKLLQHYPQTRLCVVGAIDLPPDFAALGDRLERWPLLPAHKLPDLYRTIDLNLAPLARHSEFNQGKSEIKYLEAALLNVPTIASRWGAYETAMRHGETGWLCATEEDWLNALTEAITLPEKRQAVGQAAGQDVRDRYLSRSALAESFAAWRSLLAQPATATNRWAIALLVWVDATGRTPQGSGAIAALARQLTDQGQEVDLYLRAAGDTPAATVEAACQAWESRLEGSAVRVRDAKEAIAPADLAIATDWATAYRADALVHARSRLLWLFDDPSDRVPPGFPEREMVAAALALPLRPVLAGPALAATLAPSAAIRVPLLTTPAAIDPALLAQPIEPERHAESARSLLWLDDPSQAQTERDLAITALTAIANQQPDLQIQRLLLPEAIARLSAPYAEQDSTRFATAEIPKTEAYPFLNETIAWPNTIAAWGDRLRTADLALTVAQAPLIYQAAIDALACGCPLVAPTTAPAWLTALPIVAVAPEPTAIAQAVQTLSDRPDQRQDIAHRGRAAVEALTVDRAATAFINLMQEVLFIDP